MDRFKVGTILGVESICCGNALFYLFLLFPLSFFSGGPAFASSIEKIDEIEFQQLNLIQKSKHQQEQHQASETEHNVRQKSQGRLHKGIDIVSKSSSRGTHETVNLPKKHSHLNQSMHGKRSSTDATSIQYDEITFDYNSVTEVCLLCVSLPNTLSYFVLVVTND